MPKYDAYRNVVQKFIFVLIGPKVKEKCCRAKETGLNMELFV